MEKAKVVKTRRAGPDHEVITVESKSPENRLAYRKKPCSDCPWRKDAVGKFPAEAFRHSASTNYDLAKNKFSCHQSGIVKPAVCAGFLLRGAEHNLSVRIALSKGKIDYDFSDDGLDLFENYREMAIANGVDPDEDCLKPCRD